MTKTVKLGNTTPGTIVIDSEGIEFKVINIDHEWELVELELVNSDDEESCPYRKLDGFYPFRLDTEFEEK
jgi:hypothetical protein